MNHRGNFPRIASGPDADEINEPRFSLPVFDRLLERQSALPAGPGREALMRGAQNPLV